MDPGCMQSNLNLFASLLVPVGSTQPDVLECSAVNFEPSNLKARGYCEYSSSIASGGKWSTPKV